ncbi:MAG TPA: tetratricopeptide repeat protein [Blastocatellia bacterium]|nr:tetratricopeptide repeat protein [Blastocatellia bacterium]
MKRVALALALSLIAPAAFSQHQHSSPNNSKRVTLIAGLGEHHHPVSTTSAEAQRFFDEGLTLVYAFNHDEAIRSFNRALELDPNLAMAHWGVALALGPNINLDIDAEREKLAFEAVQKALALAGKATEPERAYIEALAKRYSNDPKADLKKLATDYKNAMGELARRFPDDLDAATLYAESAMDLRPWQLWTLDGKPAEGTEEIVAVLESVLKRNPDHVGANHYYIHAVEASRHPEWALPSAQRLKVLTPAAGHLVHMPSHIDIRTGNYEAAVRANAYAAEADREQFKNFGAQGVYPMMYYTHNLHFLVIANGMQGNFRDAKRAADQLEAHLNQSIAGMPEGMVAMMDGFMPVPMITLVRFQRWDDVLKTPAPDKRFPATGALWHFARGMAYVSAKKMESAAGERDILAAAAKAIPPDAVFGLNRASNILKIAENVLSAKIALAKNDKKAAIELLKKAVEVEDSLNYTEPADWVMPVRESLGAALISSGDYAEAEKVFRADLEKNPRSGRSLFGLSESLKAQGKTSAAASVQREFQVAWKNADAQLRIEDL